MDFLYSDSQIVAVCKSAGTAVAPDESGDVSLMDACREELRARALRADLWLVHRLDRPVGGVTVFARTARSAAALSALFSDHTGIVKEYAAVSAALPAPLGRWEDLLVRDARAGRAFLTDRPRPSAKRAILDTRLVAQAQVPDGGSLRYLFGVRLQTGRFHQIRAQFAGHGAPLCGDGKYGSRDNRCTVALFCRRLSFTLFGKKYDIRALPDLTKYPFALFADAPWENWEFDND